MSFTRWLAQGIAIILLCGTVFAQNAFSAPLTKGIYLTQYTMEDTPYLSYLVQHAKAVGINTFIVDFERPSPKYHQNIQMLKNNHITYVVRITMFPGGGTPAQVRSPAYWQEKYNLVKQAVAWGADQIQLDYIRYNTEQPGSSQNARDIQRIIQWYKERLAAQHVPLQLDIFGIASFGPSIYIGQDVKLFSTSADAICPMVYPSHFEPFRHHAVTPYDTVYSALQALKEQFPDNKIPFKLYPFIELSNYRYPLSHQQRIKYIVAQIRAVEDAGADGWYVWSAHNDYDSLFEVLETHKIQ